MPTQKCSSRSPPFPSDVPVVDLAKISLQCLQVGESGESKRLYEACRANAFFYLDLAGSGVGEALLKDAEKMYDLAYATFELSEEALQSYAPE